MGTDKIEEFNLDRRLLLGAAATVAASQLSGISLALAQPGKTGAMCVPTITSLTHTSFAPLKQLDAGLLNVGYAEAGPIEDPTVILLHGWP